MKIFKKFNKREYFLFLVIIIYFIFYLFYFEIFNKSFNVFLDIIKQIYWIFILVFVLMGFSNYFIDENKIKKYAGIKSEKKFWIFAIISGILSIGPIYLWYPFLAELREKGIGAGLIACFIYNRSIKIPLLPLMFFYFGIKYVFILIILIMIMSVLQGAIINKFFKYENETKN